MAQMTNQAPFGAETVHGVVRAIHIATQALLDAPRAFAEWSRSNQIHGALLRLSDRELADLGLERDGLDSFSDSFARRRA